MPLGTNPTLLQVQAFFGGPGNLRAYNRGGSYVPNIPANAGISTDPNGLTLRQFSGADKVADWSVSMTPTFVAITNSTSYTSRQMTISVANAPGAASYNTIAMPGEGMDCIVDNANTSTPTVRGRRSVQNPSFEEGAVRADVTINGVTKSAVSRMNFG